jgi:hypothetical protein
MKRWGPAKDKALRSRERFRGEAVVMGTRRRKRLRECRRGCVLKLSSRIQPGRIRRVVTARSEDGEKEGEEEEKSRRRRRAVLSPAGTDCPAVLSVDVEGLLPGVATSAGHRASSLLEMALLALRMIGDKQGRPIRFPLHRMTIAAGNARGVHVRKETAVLIEVMAARALFNAGSLVMGVVIEGDLGAAQLVERGRGKNSPFHLGRNEPGEEKGQAKEHGHSQEEEQWSGHDRAFSGRVFSMPS